MADHREFYEAYWKTGLTGWTPRDLPILHAEARLMKNHLQPGHQVLDVGCGDGRVAGFIQGLGARYQGMDVAQDAVEACRSRGLEARQQDFGQPLPWPDHHLDGAVCFEVMEHLFDPARLRDEILRVLKSGGWFLGSVPNVVYLPGRLLMLLGLFSPGGSPATSLKAPWRDPHIRFFSPGSLRRFFTESPLAADVHIYGSAFDASEAPWIYRQPAPIRQPFRWLTWPLRPLGFLCPSLFSHRIYFAVRTK